MPTPFACHWCDKPTMNETGICIDCEQAYEEGNKDIAESVRELEARVRWLEDGLKQIASKTLGLDDAIQAVLDGEPTTADEYNKGVAVLTSGMDALSKDKKYVRISDVNKEISKEWNKEDVKIDFKDRDREKKIKGSRDYWEPKKKVPKTGKKANIIQSIGYRGED